jgi:hypothetical protein
MGSSGPSTPPRAASVSQAAEILASPLEPQTVGGNHSGCRWRYASPGEHQDGSHGCEAQEQRAGRQAE